MPRCFVIQPFDDGGPYDKRYKDVLLPAVKEASLEAYRVDEDRSSSVPIDDIENNIRASEICLADITPDNPNIWYEVGFAFANDKPVVMVCAKPRPTKPPFDVQHRHIIYYTQDSPSDFKKLQTEVTERLKAQIDKTEAMRSVSSMSPMKTIGGDLTSYEIATMVSIMENRLMPGAGTTPNDIRKDMRKAGYTDVATSLSLESLSRKGLIEYTEEHGENFGEDYTYTVCTLTSHGLDWMLENKDRFKLSRQAGEEEAPQLRDEDIPF
jgi:nucleoside 2-deoxyribosyltransferase